MLRESSQKETQLSQEAAAREQAMEQQRVAAETHMIQETKLQATIAQQSKLIDFLQKPSRGSRLKLKVPHCTELHGLLGEMSTCIYMYLKIFS